MERVQFQQEKMLPELKDLVQKGLFTRAETKEILKRRTAFETALVRRVPRKTDFLRYLAYEEDVERLRLKRLARVGGDGQWGPSAHAGAKRQLSILERAVRKFRGDVSLWMTYAATARRLGARALVGRVTARALLLHPGTPVLYVLAAAHELEQGAPGSARVILERGVRMGGGEEVWRAWVRLEMRFMEMVRRRWCVLGIEEGEGEGDEARRRVMEGAIVKEVVENALKDVPKMELFEALREIVSVDPAPAKLREKLLDYMYDVMRRRLSQSL